MEALDSKRYKSLCTSTGNSYRYYSSTRSQNPTFLFIHGFPNTANIWRGHIAHFEGLGFCCIAPDMLGFGGSDKPYDPQQYVAKSLAQSLVDILDAEKIDKVVVVAHDWGCQAASRLVMYYPSRVASLVLAAVPYYEPAPFDLNTYNDQTEEAFGYSSFGYWDVFAGETNLLSEHAESLYCLFNAQDPEMWKKHFMPRGALKKWLENDRKCTVGEYETDVDRREFLANDWTAATQYYQYFIKNLHWDNVPK
ncbi:hypothetical protein G7Z17_g1291 [Cylindrodendrum hubeiense]|uniref:AB hydrolase-1 domain-containing protein n=1 Tax=Cylindrodendrum hubeiense TaxID=595255 RepID=A0A9P5LCL8_9HYPO|nr:hypothetical protein G7Z17_g1291 [Cylindrodendrum hubeiense]